MEGIRLYFLCYAISNFEKIHFFDKSLVMFHDFFFAVFIKR